MQGSWIGFNIFDCDFIVMLDELCKKVFTRFDYLLCLCCLKIGQLNPSIVVLTSNFFATSLENGLSRYCRKDSEETEVCVRFQRRSELSKMMGTRDVPSFLGSKWRNKRWYRFWGHSLVGASRSSASLFAILTCSNSPKSIRKSSTVSGAFPKHP